MTPPNEMWQPLKPKLAHEEFLKVTHTKVCPQCGSAVEVLTTAESYSVVTHQPMLRVITTTIVCENGHYQHHAE